MVTNVKLLTGIFLLLTSVLAQAEQLADPTLNRIAGVGVFAFGGVGIAGVTSQGEKDYRVILSGSSALAEFETLFATGNPQAKAYALVGILALDVERYEQLSAPLRQASLKVTIQHGCVISHVPFSAILKGIDAGGYAGE